MKELETVFIEYNIKYIKLSNRFVAILNYPSPLFEYMAERKIFFTYEVSEMGVFAEVYLSQFYNN